MTRKERVEKIVNIINQNGGIMESEEFNTQINRSLEVSNQTIDKYLEELEYATKRIKYIGFNILSTEHPNYAEIKEKATKEFDDMIAESQSKWAKMWEEFDKPESKEEHERRRKKLDKYDFISDKFKDKDYADIGDQGKKVNREDLLPKKLKEGAKSFTVGL